MSPVGRLVVQVQRVHALVEDLGAESIDLVTIIAVIEETYGVSIDEERMPLLRTPADLAAELDRLLPEG